MTTNSAALATSPPRICIAAVGSDSMTKSTAETAPTPASSGTPPDSLPSAALRHRRARTASQSSASSSSLSSLSSASSSSSATTTPSGSASIRYSAVPFSWEHRPGIPKKIAGCEDLSAGAAALPLPPPLRYHSDLSSFPRKKRSGGRIAISRDDPFAIALAACARDLAAGDHDDEELERLWGKSVGARRPSRVASPATAIAGRFGIFQLYGSCKTACSVAEATVRIPRPVTGSVYALLDPPRRSGSRRN